MNKKIRVRFAPSPTGPLHIGGVRTALYNFLHAKKHNGSFILRIEDTDRTRYVSGAEEYIKASLDWLGIHADESPWNEGAFGPYRQSERLEMYRKHVSMLIESGHAYYAFDTPDELEKMRQSLKERGIHSPKYDHSTRMEMKNSLSLSAEECNQRLKEGQNVTVRIKIPDEGVISFQDVVRGHVQFDASALDDKIILKGDGYPTYHLANVVDDYHMQITHVIRGEEWLSSTAHHTLLYQAFGWQDAIPQFVHLPLILKPSGKGKLSKRDGAKFGFPVFPMDWVDETNAETYTGFREGGFLPEAVINFLALLGWNPGNDQEIFSMKELIDLFNLEQIVKSGAQFNFEKAKWFNQHYIMQSETTDLVNLLASRFKEEYKEQLNEHILPEVINLMKPRVETLNEFISKSSYFFVPPGSYDDKNLRKRSTEESPEHFQKLTEVLQSIKEWDKDQVEHTVKQFIQDEGLSFGKMLPVLRIFITGSMAGPDLFEMLYILGKDSVVIRIEEGIKALKKIYHA